MKKTFVAIIVVLTASMFLAVTAFAGGKSSYQRCVDGCNHAKAALLKQCEKAEGAEAKSKCRTMGAKKLMEECLMRCEKRKK